jgi:hypothetical protein
MAMPLGEPSRGAKVTIGLVNLRSFAVPSTSGQP